MSGKDPSGKKWQSPSGETIACVEKLKVLRENLEEIRQLCQDALDDAVLMGCDEKQFRDAVMGVISKIESAYSHLEPLQKSREDGDALRGEGKVSDADA